MGEMYRHGKYLAAGKWYPENDLFGYPDSLIRARTSFAYQAGCGLLNNTGCQTPAIIADIGSCHGHGIATIERILHPKKILSLDRWLDFLQAQKKVIPQIAQSSAINFATINLPDIPLPDNSCDALFLIHVIEHLKDPCKHLCDMRRILKPGGFLFVATPDENNIVWKNPDDQQLFNRQNLKSILEEAGFQTTVYSIAGDEHALEVHKRKKNLAKYFPFTHKLRKFVPWQTWDKLLLSGQLTADDFTLTKEITPFGIDLLAEGRKIKLAAQ